MTSRSFTVQARVGAQRRAATRERILSAAQRLLERGDSVAGLTVARLSEEAEVSRATFYLHFPDKRHLIEALFETANQDWDELAAQGLADPNITRKELREVVGAAVGQGVTYGPIVAGVVELGEYDPEVREAWQAHMRRASEHHTQWLAKCRPDLSERQVTLLGQVLCWASERTLQRMLGLRDEAWCTPEELADTITELWWSLTHPATG